MLRRVVQWKSLLHLMKGKGSRDLENDNLSRESKPFSIYFGPKDYSARLASDQMQQLLSSAQEILLHSNNGLKHLATMTFGEYNPATEDLANRMNQITTYLQSYPPDVRNSKPHHHPSTSSWQALSIEMRQTLPLEFSLNASIYELIQKSTTNGSQSLICLFSMITIIHELAHIVMYTFASQDISPNIERVMIGGEALLATSSGFTIQTVDPSHIIIVVATASGDDWKVLDENTANLTDIASGNWSHISALPIQPFPSGFSLMIFSDVKPPSSLVPSSSSYDDYVVWVPRSDPSKPGVKY
ncbi:uncharacterized protein F5147DRAFT_774419 [Suillus discolor]|uniref:Uncharacterized protein n=1 Tax=Suillus discolor TaxID=1912936 RepID=A0A9P7JTF1_9AGAM|nr:uncharacterized protein F5147DRAFT_774419 [Suillus discolor]KAG2107198.1 hypothetical protein F5147DRAFT_774419 [Suillus discolor]